MTPQHLAGSDVHGQEFTQVASRLWIFVIPAPDRTNAALADYLLHCAKGGPLAVQGHRDVQRIGLRAEGHRTPVLESGCARTHLELDTDLWSLPVGDFAALRTHLHDVLVAEVGGVDERAGGAVELPEDGQLAHFKE